jgi:biopolymer transport protein ExbD
MKRILDNTTQIVAKINVTPIIDVSLVLVIILLVTTPMFTLPAVNVNLPPAKTKSADAEAKVSVTLGANSELAINESIVNPALFVPALRALLAKHEGADVLVIIRADETVPYASVRKVLADAREAGAARIAIATLQGEKVKL